MKIGDQVVLKSGSPKMTVCAFTEDKKHVACIWFQNDNASVDCFNQAALNVCEKNPLISEQDDRIRMRSHQIMYDAIQQRLASERDMKEVVFVDMKDVSDVEDSNVE